MCIVSDKRIEFAYLFGGIGNVGVPSERPRRKDGTEDGSDMMFFCQLAHRDDITHDMFNRNRSVVLGNVVDAAENDDRLLQQRSARLYRVRGNRVTGRSLVASYTSFE